MLKNVSAVAICLNYDSEKKANPMQKGEFVRTLNYTVVVAEVLAPSSNIWFIKASFLSSTWPAYKTETNCSQFKLKWTFLTTTAAAAARKLLNFYFYTLGPIFFRQKVA